MPSNEYTVEAPYLERTSVSTSEPKTTADGSPIRRARVNNSSAGLLTLPSSSVIRTRTSAMTIVSLLRRTCR